MNRDLAARIDGNDWPRVESDLDARGYASLGRLLDAQSCGALSNVFTEDRFRKHIVMEKHSYGLGEYKYFRYPLPGVVQQLRQALYPKLVGVARRWNTTLGRDATYPDTLEEFIAACHAKDQSRPTPLMLRYAKGGYNRLHQDLYGDVAFPLQVVVLLSAPGRDFEGGELVLTEQRARVQARPHVVRMERGEGVVIAVNERPTQGVRGPVRVAMRHGVGEVRTGERTTLGIIFHDAA